MNFLPAFTVFNVFKFSSDDDSTYTRTTEFHARRTSGPTSCRLKHVLHSVPAGWSLLAFDAKSAELVRGA